MRISFKVLLVFVSMKTSYDLVIVGAGPVGSTLATQLLKLNENVRICILEEHAKAGTPQQCSGLFSKNINDVATLQKKEIIAEIKEADFYSPLRSPLEIKTKQIQAYVVDRTLFDYRLAKEAESLGAKMMINTAFLGAKKIDDVYRIKILDKKQNKTKTIVAKYIAGCDGATSIVAKTFSFPKMESLYSYAIFVDAKTTKDKEFIKNNNVALYVGKKTAPDFFLWKIPRAGENTIEIGLASKKNPVFLMDKFIREEKINKSNISAKMGGLIPFELRSKIVKEGVVLVGDAAGQVKATTGGGVIWGMKCAGIAAKALNKTIEQDNSKYLGTYVCEFNKKAKPELKRLKLARTFLNSRSDRQMNLVLKSLNNKKIIEFIKENGDMDSITPAVVSLLKKPQLWSVFAKAIFRSLI